jgi:L,D-transpeptidase-like protein
MMHVSENGHSKYVWPVSSGSRGHDTPTGTFKPVWTSKMWYSRQYDYAPMPNAIFFHGGAAIHGTAYVGNLGRPASHGCVRLAPRNAATLYKLVASHGKAATRIVVHGTPNHGPEVAERRDYRRYADDDDYDYERAGNPPVYYQRRRYAYERPTYYYARPRRGEDYYYPRQRRYTQRGLFNSYGGYGY